MTKTELLNLVLEGEISINDLMSIAKMTPRELERLGNLKSRLDEAKKRETTSYGKI